MENVRYSLIYKFFASQIQFGYYKTGDFLPTIEELGQVYHASARTVRNAYLQLQEDGYISLSSGRRTTVVYESTPEACSQHRRGYYLARKEASPPLNEALKLLLLPLLREGCSRMSEEDVDQLRETAVHLAEGDFYISFLGGYTMLQALQNQLAINLYNEVISFYQFPHVLLRFAGKDLDPEQLRDMSGEVVAACEQNDREAIYRAYLRIQAYMNDVLFGYMSLAEQLLPAREQVAFHWGVYRDRPQRCYSLAAQIIGRVYLSCAYAPGDFLPYHAALADEYQVSYMTIRRTMNLLETLGAVSVRQGVGTMAVRPQPNPAGYQDSSVRRIHVMAREAMQFLRYAFDDIVSHFFPGVQGNARDCAERLRIQHANGLRYPAFITCMDFLLRGSSLPMQNIWEKFYEALLLDLPLLEASGRQTAGPEALIHSLEAGDAQGFRDALKEQMLQVCGAMDSIETTDK